MGRGLATTFHLLAKTKNEAAVSLLISALESRHPVIEQGALGALLDRRSGAAGREILKRLHLGGRKWKEMIDQTRGRLSGAVRDAVLSTDKQLCRNGCKAALWFHEFDSMSALINAAEDRKNPNASLAAQTALELAGLLYEQLAAPRDYHNRRDPQLVRRYVLESLENSVKRFNSHKRSEILEALLILANRDHLTLKQILRDPLHGTYLPLIEVLTRSQCHGVMRLVLSSLDDPHAPNSAIKVLAHRRDLPFVKHLLKKIGYEPSKVAANNLKRVEHIGWVESFEEVIEKLDDAAQYSAVQIVIASGMKRLEAFKLIEKLIYHGNLGGRRAASSVLERFEGAAANRCVVRALQDEDPQVQAHVVVQLRKRGIPGAMALLIDLVESPHELVRQAARQSLSEFRFQRYLASFDLMQDDIRQSTGLLVRKIDPTSLAGLRREMKVASRMRRMRALGVALAMGAVPKLEENVIELLSDDDHMVRKEAARALAHGETPATLEALREALLDGSVSVQEMAEESLRHLAGVHAVASLPDTAESEPNEEHVTQ